MKSSTGATARGTCFSLQGGTFHLTIGLKRISTPWLPWSHSRKQLEVQLRALSTSGDSLRGLQAFHQASGAPGPVQPVFTEGLLLWDQTSEKGAAQLAFQDGHSEAGSESTQESWSPFPPTKLRPDIGLGRSCDSTPRPSLSNTWPTCHMGNLKSM